MKKSGDKDLSEDRIGWITKQAYHFSLHPRMKMISWIRQQSSKRDRWPGRPLLPDHLMVAQRAHFSNFMWRQDVHGELPLPKSRGLRTNSNMTLLSCSSNTECAIAGIYPARQVHCRAALVHISAATRQAFSLLSAGKLLENCNRKILLRSNSLVTRPS